MLNLQHRAAARRRAIALLEHKPWAADDGETWLAAFRWPDGAGEVEGAELEVGPGLLVDAAGAGRQGAAPPCASARCARTRRAAVARARSAPAQDAGPDARRSATGAAARRRAAAASAAGSADAPRRRDERRRRRASRRRALRAAPRDAPDAAERTPAPAARRR